MRLLSLNEMNLVAGAGTEVLFSWEAGYPGTAPTGTGSTGGTGGGTGSGTGGSSTEVKYSWEK